MSNPLPSAEQYRVPSVVKAVDKRKIRRSAETFAEQYGAETVVKGVDDRKNERYREQSTVRGTLAKSSTGGGDG